MLHIREATASDADVLADLTTQLGYPSQTEEIIRRLQALSSRRSCVLVATMRDGVVEWVQVSAYSALVTDNAAGLCGLVVDEEWRGQGIGRALLKAAEAWARERNCSAMYVRTNAVRHSAHAFHRQFGYQQVKTSLTFTKSLGKGE